MSTRISKCGKAFPISSPPLPFVTTYRVFETSVGQKRFEWLTECGAPRNSKILLSFLGISRSFQENASQLSTNAASAQLCLKRPFCARLMIKQLSYFFIKSV